MTRRRAIIAAAGLAVLLVVALGGVVALTQGSGGATLTVYTARLHYGEEAAFERFAERTGYDVKLFGGTGPALNERLEAEGKLTQADVLITVDGANLRQATEENLLRPTRSAEVEGNVPEALRDPRGRWFGLTTRARTVMRSSERVRPAEVTSYASLGDPRRRGKVCLRASDSVYNGSFVADRIAKFGRPATERLLRGWFRNDPEVLGSDVDVLKAIESGRCDVGLANSYYLARELKENPDLPVAPAFVDQDARGTHVNISGYGITRYAKQPEEAQELVEFLSSPEAQSMFAAANGEFPVNPKAKLPPLLERWRGFRADPIDVSRSGPLQAEAVELMNEVGWE